MGNNVEQVSDSNFDEKVIKSDLPVLVDFWAPWCGPCRMVGPVLEEVASEYLGKVKVVKVNVDESQQIAGKLGIRSIPTIALYQSGEITNTVIGAQPKGVFTDMLDKIVSN